MKTKGKLTDDQPFILKAAKLTFKRADKLDRPKELAINSGKLRIHGTLKIK